MRVKVLRLFFSVICINIYISAFSQDNTERARSVTAIIDSLKTSGIILNENRKPPEIVLSTGQSVTFLQQIYKPQYWNNPLDPLRQALGQLIFEASHQPYDSSKYILQNYPYDSLSIPWDKFYIWEPLKLKIPSLVVSLQADTVAVSDSSVAANVTDSLNRAALPVPEQLQLAEMKDTTIMVVIDTLAEVTSSGSGFPFRYFNFPYQGDSIQVAVRSLVKYLEDRDSSVINFTGVGKMVTPLWLNTKSNSMARFWLRNEFSDSVTVWIGNTSRDTIGLYLEQGINFRRPVKQGS
jgi:hypothetical protein